MTKHLDEIAKAAYGSHEWICGQADMRLLEKALAKMQEIALSDDMRKELGCYLHEELKAQFNISGIDDGAKCTTCQEIVQYLIHAAFNKIKGE